MTSSCPRLGLYICVYIYIHACAYWYMCLCVYACVYACVCVSVCMGNTCMHAYIHTCLHACIHTHTQCCATRWGGIRASSGHTRSGSFVHGPGLGGTLCGSLVCVCVCVYMYIYVCVCVIYKCVRRRKRTYAGVWHVFMCTHVYAYIIYKCVCVYIYIYIYTHTHTYLHKHTQTVLWKQTRTGRSRPQFVWSCQLWQASGAYRA